MAACERSFSIVRKAMHRPSYSAFTPDSFMLSAPHYSLRTISSRSPRSVSSFT